MKQLYLSKKHVDLNERMKAKKKWQIALRRYVVEQQVSTFYAPYFGLDILQYRNWLEAQFGFELTWDGFGQSWQLEQIVPVTFFNFSNKEELKLCWSFLNTQVERLNREPSCSRIDTLTAKRYFQNLLASTGYHLCREMIKKIEEIENRQVQPESPARAFISQNLGYLHAVKDFGEYEFLKMNSGSSTKDILAERQMLSKFGG